MKISIYSIGKTKESFVLLGETEYLKRLKSYCQLEIHDLGSKTKENDTPAIIMEKEAVQILDRIEDGEFLIALDERGKEFSSPNLATFLESKMIGGVSHLSFVIGGAFGLHEKVRKRANLILALSQFTFPHQLARLFLIEQIYRAFSIIRKEPYHK